MKFPEIFHTKTMVKTENDRQQSAEGTLGPTTNKITGKRRKWQKSLVLKKIYIRHKSSMQTLFKTDRR